MTDPTPTPGNDGDVWISSRGAFRRFRAHLGHVVEVLADHRTRRVGRGLTYAQPWLRVDGPLEEVVQRAMREAGAVPRDWHGAPQEREEDPPPSTATGDATPPTSSPRRERRAAARDQEPGWPDTLPAAYHGR